MKLFFLFCLVILLPRAALAQSNSVTLSDGVKIFYRLKKAAPGAPTLVLLNGLTYSMNSWDPFTAALEHTNPDLGILRYDMKGMGETLLAGTLPVNYSIQFLDQVNELKEILGSLKIEKPELVGLSYGGGIALAFAAKYPEFVHKLFLLAPFTEALADQDRFIQSEVAANRLAFPFNPATDDELYAYFLRDFIYRNYPLQEPVVLENPFKLEAIYKMVQGIRLFRATDITNKLPEASVHLMVAVQDQYIPRAVLDRFWDAVPPRSRASRINISRTEHKMPQAIPQYAAAWIVEVLRNPAVSSGRVFEGNTSKFEAQSGAHVIHLPK